MIALDVTTDSMYVGLMKEAIGHARKSPDMSTQNAAVLLHGGCPIRDTWAVNEFARGSRYLDERWERPAKYEWIEHAERNAIYNAARHGICTEGLTLLAVWAACADCARGIVQSGIPRLVTLRPQQDPHGHWGASINTAMTILEEGQVEVVFIDGPLGMDFPIRRNGEDVYF